MLHYRAKCAECIHFKETKCKCTKHTGNPFQLLIKFSAIKPWWSSKEEESFYPSMKEWWSFLFKDFFWQSFLTHQSLHFYFFFNVSSQSLSELGIPWLHDPDRCSAAQVRVVLASSACQEASALLQDHCSHCCATRQKHSCHRENAFLILGNWKPVADKPMKCHATVPLVHPYLVF